MLNYEVVMTCLKPLISFFLCLVIEDKYFPQEDDSEETQKLPSTEPSCEQGNYERIQPLFPGYKEDRTQEGQL